MGARSWVAVAMAVGCSPSSPATPEDSSGEGTTHVVVTGSTTATTDEPTADGPVGTADGSTGHEATGQETTEGPMPGGECDGRIYQCGDGIDNDGDGAVDLADLECINACDDDESSFHTGLPGGNDDCHPDCFFDDNVDHGDDDCQWNLQCDPAEPEPRLCPFEGAGMCNMPSPPSAQCVETCVPLVPPGCDCFGCCELLTPDGIIAIYLQSAPPCSLEHLDACRPCTPQIDVCGQPCDRNSCITCFGQTSPPLPFPPCRTEADCNRGGFCYLGCCYVPK